jgi:hypothetical protein
VLYAEVVEGACRVLVAGVTCAVCIACQDSSPNHDAGLVSDSAVDSTGPADAVPLDALQPLVLQETAYLKASNTDSGDLFGISHSVSGHTLAVGGLYEDSATAGVNGNQDDNSLMDSGAVYVFRRSNGNWSQEAYIKASNPDALDRFGQRVALDGDVLAVTAGGEDSAASGVNADESDNDAAESGAVYIFRRTNGNWVQEAYVKPQNPDTTDQFGWSLDVSADTVVVGAPEEDSSATGIDGDGTNDLAQNSGAAYVFRHDGQSWVQEAYIKASNAEFGDFFGRSVAIDADTIVVAASGEDSASSGVDGDQTNNGIGGSGAAYVFTRVGTTWTQAAYLKASNPGGDDKLGWRNELSISGDMIAVAASLEDSNATDINGDQLDNSAADSGAVYVLSRDSNEWSQVAYIKAPNAEAGDQFGFETVILGDRLVVSAVGEDSGALGIGADQSSNTHERAGAVFVFERVGTEWEFKSYVRPTASDPYDEFGYAVSLEANTLVVAAEGEDGGGIGVNADKSDNSAENSGALFVYEWLPAP